VKKNLLIIGKNSYVGTYLNRIALIRGWEVVTVSSEECNLLNLEESSRFFQSLPVGIYSVVFLAVINKPLGNSYNGFINNLSLVQNLILALPNIQIEHFIYFSSVDVYGNPSELPIHEESPVLVDNWYGLAKLNSEWMLNHQLETPICIVRIPGVIGTGPGDRSIIGKFLRQVLEGKPINILGDGQTLRDYIYVKDLCDIVLKLIEKKVTGKLNIVKGRSNTLNEIIGLIEENCLTNVSVCYEQTNSVRNFDLTFDASRFLKLFPDFHFTELSSVIEEYLE
jgi:UDP-glucose 4-epimerase